MGGRFQFMDAGIPGLKLIDPFIFEDERGLFRKCFERALFKANGINMDVDEYIESESRKYVVRGLHIQMKYPQAKLVRVIRGEIWDVAVDLREGSPTFGKWHAETLSEENGRSFYIPAGFAHGFLALTEKARVGYHCAGRYYSEYDGGVRWDDPDIDIAWPLPGMAKAILSEKDRALPGLKDLNCAQRGDVKAWKTNTMSSL